MSIKCLHELGPVEDCLKCPSYRTLDFWQDTCTAQIFFRVCAGDNSVLVCMQLRGRLHRAPKLDVCNQLVVVQISQQGQAVNLVCATDFHNCCVCGCVGIRFTWQYISEGTGWRTLQAQHVEEGDARRWLALWRTPLLGPRPAQFGD